MTRAVTPPLGTGFLLGVSTAFDFGAGHRLEEGAVVREEVGLHVRVDMGMEKASVGTQIGVLRRLLFLDGYGDGKGRSWARVREVRGLFYPCSTQC